MAEAAVTFLLEQVKEVIVTYSDLISNAATEFDDLGKDLEELKAILKDMDNRSCESNQMRNMEKQLREVVYEVEDTIDSWLTEATAPKNKRGFRKSMAKTFGLESNRIALAKQVKSLRQDKVRLMLDKAQKLRTAQGSAGGATMEEQLKMKKDQSFRQEKVVGFEDEEKKLVGYLMEEQAGLDIISIIGMPGLGKSTLAWKIYHDSNIGFAFPIRIWVHVSKRFNFRDVCLKILKKFTGDKDMSRMSDVDLTEAVLAYLKEEKFLLVMDDVWEPEDWNAFKNVLPSGNGKGKVLITSRYEKVGRSAKLITEHHNLRFLTNMESWVLLQLEVFGDLQICPEELKGIGYSIAEKCGGVPLTIVVMGGILKDKLLKKKIPGLVRSEWNKMIDNVNYAGSDANKEKVILDLVKLSYDGLPYDMREPFLYLGVFPDDYEIPTWTLTRLWIAEGFIKPKDNKTMEEIAEENLDDLVSRKLLIVMKTNPMGEVRVCRVHDMIRKFCVHKAEEQNLFQEIKMVEEGAGDSLRSKIENIHRLCIHSKLPDFFEKKVPGPHVRSFLCFQKQAFNLNPTFISAIPENFPLLRILHSQPIKFNQFPQKITNLNHLRYIILCVDDLKIIPDPISQLWNLQTIVVDTKQPTLTSRANIWRMIRLRHFKTKAEIVIDTTTCQGDAGKNLQTLTRVSVPKSDIAAISKKACNLKILGIRGNLATLFENMSLESMNSLENLKLENELEFGAPSENPLQRFPEWNRFPLSLKRLTLSNTYFHWSHMLTLAKIRGLEILKLKKNAFRGSSWNAAHYVFDTLQYLLIVDADLKDWEASPYTFPGLGCLVIRNCENLKAIPMCVGKHLHKLELERVGTSVVDSAKDIEADKRAEDPNQDKWGARFKLSIGATCGQDQN